MYRILYFLTIQPAWKMKIGTKFEPKVVLLLYSKKVCHFVWRVF